MEFEVADLAPDTDEGKGVLDHALQRARDLANAEFGEVGTDGRGGFGHDSQMI
jgi:hypothetical protein